MKKPLWLIFALLLLLTGYGITKFFRHDQATVATHHPTVTKPPRQNVQRSPESATSLPNTSIEDISEENQETNPATAGVKFVDGVKMLRGRTLDGEEVWIPTAPEAPSALEKDQVKEPVEFLPAPDAR